MSPHWLGDTPFAQDTPAGGSGAMLTRSSLLVSSRVEQRDEPAPGLRLHVQAQASMMRGL